MQHNLCVIKLYIDCVSPINQLESYDIHTQNSILEFHFNS